MERRYLRPNERCPVELSEDFYRQIVHCPSIATGSGRSASEAYERDTAFAANLATEVQRTMAENREDIDCALMKQVAPSAVNVTGNQFENLISLSFDQEQLILEEENRRRRLRERVVAAALPHIKAPMNVPTPGTFGHQQDPERFAQAIGNIAAKALDAKVNIQDLILLLDKQEKVEWPDMLDKMSSLASAMTQLQNILKKSAIPSGFEDFGFFLRTHVLVPHCLSNEIDEQLQCSTDNRLHCWNHDAAPEYLRTKLTPEMEADELQIDSEKGARSYDQVNKQITAMNKHIDTMLTSLAENARHQAEQQQQQDVPTYISQDTLKLVRAVINGDGLRSSRGSATGPSEPGHPNVTGQASSTHPIPRTPSNIISPQPQRR